MEFTRLAAFGKQEFLDRLEGRTQSLVKQALQLGVSSPLQLEPVLDSLGHGPRLSNFHLATKVLVLGRLMLYIPVQISQDSKGRPSLYFLEPGKETLAGYLIDLSNGETYQRFVKRLTGKATPAQTGDAYAERVETLDGLPVQNWEGRLEVLDPRIGLGRIHVTAANGVVKPETSIWIGWSLIWIKD